MDTEILTAIRSYKEEHPEASDDEVVEAVKDQFSTHKGIPEGTELKFKGRVPATPPAPVEMPSGDLPVSAETGAPPEPPMERSTAPVGNPLKAGFLNILNKMGEAADNEWKRFETDLTVAADNISKMPEDLFRLGKGIKTDFDRLMAATSGIGNAKAVERAKQVEGPSFMGDVAAATFNPWAPVIASAMKNPHVEAAMGWLEENASTLDAAGVFEVTHALPATGWVDDLLSVGFKGLPMLGRWARKVVSPAIGKHLDDMVMPREYRRAERMLDAASEKTIQGMVDNAAAAAGEVAAPKAVKGAGESAGPEALHFMGNPAVSMSKEEFRKAVEGKWTFTVRVPDKENPCKWKYFTSRESHDVALEKARNYGTGFGTDFNARGKVDVPTYDDIVDVSPEGMHTGYRFRVGDQVFDVAEADFPKVAASGDEIDIMYDAMGSKIRSGGDVPEALHFADDGPIPPPSHEVVSRAIQDATIGAAKALTVAPSTNVLRDILTQVWGFVTNQSGKYPKLSGWTAKTIGGAGKTTDWHIGLIHKAYTELLKKGASTLGEHKLLNQAAARWGARIPDAETWVTRLRTRGQLRRDLGFSDQQADGILSMMDSFAEVQSEKLGITPDQWYRQYGPKIQAPSDQARAQGLIDTWGKAVREQYPEESVRFEIQPATDDHPVRVVARRLDGSAIGSHEIPFTSYWRSTQYPSTGRVPIDLVEKHKGRPEVLLHELGHHFMGFMSDDMWSALKMQAKSRGKKPSWMTPGGIDDMHDFFSRFHMPAEGGKVRAAALGRYHRLDDPAGSPVFEFVEGFANAFVRWVRGGKSPTPILEETFKDFKKFLTKAVPKLEGTVFDAELTPNMRSFFGQLFRTDKEVTAEMRAAWHELDLFGRQGDLSNEYRALIDFVQPGANNAKDLTIDAWRHAMMEMGDMGLDAKWVGMAEHGPLMHPGVIGRWIADPGTFISRKGGYIGKKVTDLVRWTGLKMNHRLSRVWDELNGPDMLGGLKSGSVEDQYVGLLLDGRLSVKYAKDEAGRYMPVANVVKETDPEIAAYARKIEDTINLNPDLKNELMGKAHRTREFLDHWHEKINHMRASYGLDPMGYQDNYLTHLVTDPMVRKAVFDSQDGVAREAFFRFSKPRKGGQQYGFSAVDALNAYVPSALNHYYWTRVLQKWNGFKVTKEGVEKVVEGLRKDFLRQAPEAVNVGQGRFKRVFEPSAHVEYVDDWLGYLAHTGEPKGPAKVAKDLTDWVGSLFGPERGPKAQEMASEAMRHATQIIYLATLGGKLGPALRNSTQALNALLKCGPRAFGKAMLLHASDLPGIRQVKEAIATLFDTEVAGKYTGEIATMTKEEWHTFYQGLTEAKDMAAARLARSKAFLTKKGRKRLYDLVGAGTGGLFEGVGHVGKAKKFDTAVRVTMKPFEWAERFNRRMTTTTAILDAMHHKRSFRDAIRHARNVLAETQFDFTAVGTIPLLRGAAIRGLLQYSRFPLQQLDFMVNALTQAGKNGVVMTEEVMGGMVKAAANLVQGHGGEAVRALGRGLASPAVEASRGSPLGRAMVWSTAAAGSIAFMDLVGVDLASAFPDIVVSTGRNVLDFMGIVDKEKQLKGRADVYPGPGPMVQELATRGQQMGEAVGLIEPTGEKSRFSSPFIPGVISGVKEGAQIAGTGEVRTSSGALIYKVEGFEKWWTAAIRAASLQPSKKQRMYQVGGEAADLDSRRDKAQRVWVDEWAAKYREMQEHQKAGRHDKANALRKEIDSAKQDAIKTTVRVGDSEQPLFTRASPGLLEDKIRNRAKAHGSTYFKRVWDTLDREHRGDFEKDFRRIMDEDEDSSPAPASNDEYAAREKVLNEAATLIRRESVKEAARLLKDYAKDEKEFDVLLKLAVRRSAKGE